MPPMTSTEPVGLRAQKKLETRQAISDHATRLFIERGFDATTIADIASAARVAKMTVTNYFPRKEDLALDHADAFVASLAGTVAARSPGQSAVAALHDAFREALATRNPVLGFSGRPFARMVAESTVLVARLRELHEKREEALAELLAAEAREAGGGRPGAGRTGEAGPSGADELTPYLAAAQIGGVHRALFQELQRRSVAGESEESIAAAVAPAAEAAFAQLTRALGDYAVRPQPPAAADGADKEADKEADEDDEADNS
ncbi:TetR family transcriptional regulator [Streptodolium elevatio]|uniref:TetR family transcriptional regulator n=2 Tax=Streptodolium elevatio TaxID=3157996 RepID=A0ABV3DJ81_9ACTN